MVGHLTKVMVGLMTLPLFILFKSLKRSKSSLVWLGNTVLFFERFPSHRDGAFYLLFFNAHNYL